MEKQIVIRVMESESETLSALNLVSALNKAFWNKELTDQEIANDLLEMMDSNIQTIQFDSALEAAHRELSIWSRTEENTGEVLDAVHDILAFNESMETNPSTCCKCNTEVNDELFCSVCEEKGYHHCERCGDVILASKWDISIGGLVCLEKCKGDKGIIFVSSQKASDIINTMNPIGIFCHQEGELWVGIDNTTGESWVEEFENKVTCFQWLRGDIEIDDLNHIPRSEISE